MLNNLLENHLTREKKGAIIWNVFLILISLLYMGGLYYIVFLYDENEDSEFDLNWWY